MRGHYAYYNDNDRFMVPWLRQLIADGLLTDGEVDERDIKEVKPEDLKGFSRVHLFAGIGGWDYALQLAGFPDDQLVWTGSLPCQPFSQAGKGGGTDDTRHLWPEALWLISVCRPPTFFGEQVGSRLGREWLDRVLTDLETVDYAVGEAALSSCELWRAPYS